MRLLLLFALALTVTACQGETDSVPPTDAGTVEAATDDPNASADGVSTAGEFADPSARLNLNTATEADMMALPGVGERMAHEFEEYRPWTSVAQFRREIGKYIDDDQAVIDGYLEHVFVPIDMNASDAETMMQLPGVSADEAQMLVDNQPYASVDEFLTTYEGVSGEPDAEAARMYLAE